jgi:hypothetical protein
VVKGNSRRLHLCSSSLEPKTLLVRNINGRCVISNLLVVLEGNARVFGKNVDKKEVEVRIGVEIFLSKTFQKFHIIIWSWMKLEDVL